MRHARRQGGQVRRARRTRRLGGRGRAGRPRRGRRRALTPPAPALRAESLGPRPDRLAVGRGTALLLDGRAHAEGRGIDHLTVLIDGQRHPALGWGMPEPGTLRPAAGYWWGMAPIGAVDSGRRVTLELEAQLTDGAGVRTGLGEIELQPRLTPPTDTTQALRAASGEKHGPLVAIAMATFEPPIGLFRRQVDSIRAQTHPNWICVISDDASSDERLEAMRDLVAGDDRFLLVPGSERLGTYGNFERALALVPAEADYVAPCDQDDRWHDDKLGALLAAFTPATRLAYGDMRIVDRAGETLADTYWTERPNNHSDFGSMVLANTVTGAASMFDRHLLEDALPFPPPVADAFHDHWIAQVALALGEISYVDRPLHDYVQHGGAALGHRGANAAGRFSGSLPNRLRLGLANAREHGLEDGWRHCFELYRRLRLNSMVLEMRCGERMDPHKREILLRFGNPGREAAWLGARGTRSLLRATETLGRERAILAGLAWQQAASLRSRGRAILE